MAAANANTVSKHPSTIMVEAPATVSRKQEMEAKHDLELERIKNERELKVGNNKERLKTVGGAANLFQSFRHMSAFLALETINLQLLT